MPPHPSLFERAEYRGEWWLPDKQDRIPGVLTLSQGEPRLSLMGMFAAAAEALSPTKAFTPSAIYGETSDGTKISLWRNIGTKMTFGFGPPSSEYVAGYAAIGAHVLESVKLHELEVSFTHLDDWVAAAPFTERIVYRKRTANRRRTEKVEMSFPRPSGMRVGIPARRLVLSLDYSMNSDGTRHRKVWSFESFLRIESDKPKSLDWFLDSREDLRKMLALFVGESVYTARLRTIDDDGNIIHFYHQQRGASEGRESQPAEVLFALPAIRKYGVTKVLRRGFEVLKKFKPVIDLFLGTIYPPSMFVEFEFMALMQALESYHRRAYRGRYVPRVTYEHVIAPMLAAIDPATPADLRQKLKDALRFANEHSLRKRLRRMFEDLEGAPYALISKKAASELANLLVDTRNALTHFPVGDTHKPPLKGRPLSVMNDRLQVLCALMLLQQIGFDEEGVIKRIRQHPRYRGLCEPT